ncbi:minor tail protein [Mycobacterium phage Maru]|nr:minor tail protein [Mycobacterium phage Maru]
MGVYIGDTPISKIMAGASPNAGKVYIGSTQVWPEVEFPLVYEDVNLTDALVPAGATALVIEQLVGGGASGLAGQNQSGAGTYTNRGGTGGGGGAVIGQHIIPISELGPTFSLQIGAGGEQSTSDTTRNNGGPTIFSSGSIVLTAGGGSANGGVASQSGQWYVPMANGTAGGVNNTMGGAAGGAEGVSYSHSGNPQNDNEKWDALSADPAGTAMQVLPGGLKPGNGGSQSGTGQRPGGGGGGRLCAHLLHQHLLQARYHTRLHHRRCVDVDTAAVGGGGHQDRHCHVPRRARGQERCDVRRCGPRRSRGHPGDSNTHRRHRYPRQWGAHRRRRRGRCQQRRSGRRQHVHNRGSHRAGQQCRRERSGRRQRA